MTKFHGFEEQRIVDTSEREPVYLLTTDEGRYLRVSRSAFHFLHMVDRGVPLDVIAQNFTRHPDRAVSREEVEVAYNKLMERVRALDKSTDITTFGLKYPRRLISAPLVRRVSSLLTGAYNGAVALLLVGAVFAALALQVRILRGVDLPALVMPHLWSGYVLLLGSLVIHEFGHAAACARYAARPAEIGVGIYFIYPALYSDVTDAWRLTRWQRVVVDLGGVFFQAVTGASFVFGYQLTGSVPLLAASILVTTNCLFSLNPLFKFDGYWVISDALGVTDLRADAWLVASVLSDRVRGRTGRDLRWSRQVAVGILIFGAVAAASWTMFMVRVIPGLWEQLSHYPVLLLTFARGLREWRGTATFGDALNFLLATYFVVLGARMAYGLAKGSGSFLFLHASRIIPWFRARRAGAS